jgi:Leucine-rich repeat (LRR) protein
LGDSTVLISCEKESPYIKQIKLKYLNIEFAHFPKLQSIICSDNNIKELTIGNCKNLKEIDCSYNQISKLNIYNCPMLNNLTCFNNNLNEQSIEFIKAKIPNNCSFRYYPLNQNFCLTL